MRSDGGWRGNRACETENAPDGSFICPDGDTEGRAQQMVDLSVGERMGQHFNVE
ncbi:Titin, partial [Clarias magur]